MPFGYLQSRDYILDQKRGGKGFAASLGPPPRVIRSKSKSELGNPKLCAGSGAEDAWARFSATLEMRKTLP